MAFYSFITQLLASVFLQLLELKMKCWVCFLYCYLIVLTLQAFHDPVYHSGMMEIFPPDCLLTVNITYSKKYLYEVVIVPKALYGAEAWGMRSAERRKVNVLEMKCLRSLVGVSRMYRVRNEEVRRRAGIEMSQQVEQIRDYWDGLGMWKEWMSIVWPAGWWSRK